MFTHLLAGCLIFLIFGKLFGYDISAGYLLGGAIMGALPDILSYLFFCRHGGKWAHRHRDNITHSIFFPILALLLLLPFDMKFAVITLVALISHTIIDLLEYKIGWGVKLLHPFSELQLKPFHKKGKWIYTQAEIDAEVEKYGDPNWFRNLFLRWTATAIIEWGSLFLTIAIII